MKVSRSIKYCCLLLLFLNVFEIFNEKGKQNFSAQTSSGSSCLSNQLGCGNTGAKRNIALLLTKDDGSILKSWFKENSRFFTALVVIDGSLSRETQKFFSKCNSTYYFHESSFSFLKDFSDGELRELGHKIITRKFGYDLWITMAHTDEFYVHSPLKVIEQAEKENADFVSWRALHVLPHPSEYENYLLNPDAPVPQLFRHYYHFGPAKGAFLERRMFYSKPGLHWDHRQGSILPLNLKKEVSIKPAYMHYKVHDLSLDAYTTSGIHRKHWSKVSDEGYAKHKYEKRGVGIRWKVHHVRDFFVDHWPNSSKYKYVSKYENNKIEPYLDIGESFKDSYRCEATLLFL
mmetsp:Transcript_6375/g.21305  ORF Transcript_6375/g.21305 Transcript_6375/m.21305 type:complete len:346 (+) Transcript_6375:93-1130(+)